MAVNPISIIHKFTFFFIVDIPCKHLLVLKTSSRRLEEVLEINKMFTRISVLIYGLLRNLDQYLTNLYLTNLYFTNQRWIQNALIRTPIFFLFWNSISRINSKSTLQNRWGNKYKVLSNILHKTNEWSFILIFIFNLHLKNMFTLKKSSRLLICWWKNQVIDLL